jgi:von Willebrand factor type A domain
VLAGAAPARAQDDPPAVLLVMDASDSMAKDAGNGQTRLQAAKAALQEAIEALPDRARVGLRLYGHRLANVSRSEGCRDTELVVPVGPADKAALSRQVDGYAAKGRTPIGRSLRAAGQDLEGQSGRKIVVLVSDGGDNCAPPDPCRVAREISANGVKLRIQSVGFQVSGRAKRQLQCIAEAGGGKYTDAQDPDQLGGQLRALLARAFRDYRAQGKPIQGGATPPQAVPIATGQWLDSLSAAGQERDYRIALAKGERLWASATIVRRNDVRGEAGAGPLAIGEFSLSLGPAANVEATGHSTSFNAQLQDVGGRGASVAVRSPTIGGDDVDFARPRQYVLRVALERIGDFEGVEYPVEITVYKLARLPSQVPPERAALATPGGRDQSAARQPGSLGSYDADDDDPPVALAGGVGAALGLLIGGVVAVRRRS